MKTIVSDNPVELVQREIDKLPAGTTVALALNEDTVSLDLSRKMVYQVCEADNLLSSSYGFDVPVSEYKEEQLDLCILGLGYKGQIGFNEVGTPYDSKTHWQKLTDSTKEEYSFFGDVPDEGLTMGIMSICSAKRIIVLATGERRADAVFGMIYGRNDSTVPAAFLQIPVNVEVYLDKIAASKL